MSIKRTTGTMGAIVIAAAMAACGGSSNNNGGSCPTHANPTFQIGLSDQQGGFQSQLTDGQMVKMTMGSQGGCHIWLAFRTDGFAAKGATIHFTIVDHDATGALSQQVVSMDAMVDFSPDAAAPNMCEAGAFKAFMLQANMRENHHVMLTVTITDSTGASAMKTVDNIQALWPDPIQGLNRADFCGTM
jgi:hypothetical protein